MERTLTIDGRPVVFRATAAVPRLYRMEYGRDIIIVDCGVGFPEDDMYGVVRGRQAVGVFADHLVAADGPRARGRHQKGYGIHLL